MMQCIWVINVIYIFFRTSTTHIGLEGGRGGGVLWIMWLFECNTFSILLCPWGGRLAGCPAIVHPKCASSLPSERKWPHLYNSSQLSFLSTCNITPSASAHLMCWLQRKTTQHSFVGFTRKEGEGGSSGPIQFNEVRMGIFPFMCLLKDWRPWKGFDFWIGYTTSASQHLEQKHRWPTADRPKIDESELCVVANPLRRGDIFPASLSLPSFSFNTLRFDFLHGQALFYESLYDTVTERQRSKFPREQDPLVLPNSHLTDPSICSMTGC